MPPELKAHLQDDIESVMAMDTEGVKEFLAILRKYRDREATDMDLWVSMVRSLLSAVDWSNMSEVNAFVSLYVLGMMQLEELTHSE